MHLGDWVLLLGQPKESHSILDLVFLKLGLHLKGDSPSAAEHPIGLHLPRDQSDSKLRLQLRRLRSGYLSESDIENDAP